MTTIKKLWQGNKYAHASVGFRGFSFDLDLGLDGTLKIQYPSARTPWHSGFLEI
jgi:hypothetical protein